MKYAFKKFRAKLLKTGQVGAIVGALFVGVVLLGVFDFGLEKAVNRSGILSEPVDMQSRATLFSKINYMKQVTGPTVAILGDSTVLGAEMQEAGDSNWRSHCFDELIKGDLNRPATVVNFGLNGALITDIERLTHIVVETHPQLLLIALDLGNFALPFEPSHDYFSRQWIRNFEISPGGRLVDRSLERADIATRLDDSVDAFLNQYWFAYRIRDFVQWRFFDGPPAELVRTTVRHGMNFLRGKGLSDPRVKLARNVLQALRRYDTIDLSDESAQVAAVRSLLTFLKERHQKTVIFYVPPNPDQKFLLESRSRYFEQWIRIKGLVSEVRSPEMTVLMDSKPPPPSQYNDDIHFTQEGYENFVRMNLARILANKRLAKQN